MITSLRACVLTVARRSICRWHRLLRLVMVLFIVLSTTHLQAIPTIAVSMYGASLMAGKLTPTTTGRTITAPAPITNSDVVTITRSLIDSTLFLPVVIQQSAGQVTGNVYVDGNTNGAHDPSETGVSDIVVSAYDAGGNRVSTTTTTAGQFTLLGLRLGSPYRIEFTNLPVSMSAGPHGVDSQTTVAFTTAVAVGTAPTTSPGHINLGLVDLTTTTSCNDVAEINLATTCYGFGATGDAPAIIEFPYSSGNDGSSTNSADYDGPHPVLATTQQVGSVHGLAYDAVANTLYAAAFMKRHSAFGPAGPGAIYRLDLDSDAVTTFATVANAGSDPHPVGTDYLRDPAFHEVGTTGLGDLELSADRATLYTINLNTRALIAIATATGNQRVLGEVPNPGCVNGAARPFALAIEKGQLYVGGVCTAEHGGTVNDLRAYVYRYDPLAAVFSATPAILFSLNYPRGCIDRVPGELACKADAEWQPWVTAFSELPRPYGREFYGHAQPWLTDIEFDDGAMVLGFRDRMGDLFGVKTAPPPPNDTSSRCLNNLCSVITAGDILRATPDGEGWRLEQNAQATGRTTAGINNGQGPGNGEYYYQESYDLRPTMPRHDETAQGGLVQVPNQGDVVTTALNPIPFDQPQNTFDGGVIWLSNTTGQRSRSYRIFDGDASPPIEGKLDGKNNGLGDLEVLCGEAPIEIGNRVWLDLDHNGVQDPDEAPLPEITVQLYRTNVAGATLIGTTTTNATGEYYFGGPNNTNLTVGNRLEPQTTYQLRVSLTDPNLEILVPFAEPTVQNATLLGDGNDDARDADGDNGLLIPGFSTIALTTGDSGENNYTYDFGFYSPFVAIGNLVWLDNGSGDGVAGDGVVNGDEAGIDGVVVELYQGTTATGTPLSTATTTGGGFYLFDRLTPGDYVVHIPASQFAAGAPLYDPDRVMPYISSQPEGRDTPADDNLDENGQNQSPAQLATNGISSTVIRLDLGGEPTAEAGQQATTSSELPDANVNLTVDFGFAPINLVSIGSTVFLDANDNGMQDIGDSGISTVTVQLQDVSGAVVATTVTDGNGDYFFGELAAGQYRVVIPSPPGASPLSSTDIATTDGDNQTDGDDNGMQPGGEGTTVSSPLITLQPGSEPTNEVETFQGGTQDDTDGTENTDANGDMTVDFGFRPGEIVAPQGGIGNLVWRDDGTGSGVASDGIVNGTEAGISGVEVQLYAGMTVTGTPSLVTQTDASGLYLFQVPISTLDASYVVHIPASQFAEGGPLADMLSSTPEGGDNAIDDNGDENGQNQSTPVVTGISSTVINLSEDSEPINEAGVAGPSTMLEDNDVDTTVDFGFVPIPTPVSIGSTIFLDANDNGMQDVGESGIASVTLQLQDVSGAVIATTVTDGNGDYFFGGLAAGQYRVVIPLPPAASPRSSTDIATTDGDNQTDGDDNGLQLGGDGTVVTSPLITLLAGGEPTNTIETFQGGTQDDMDGTNNTDANGDMTIDFGFVPTVCQYGPYPLPNLLFLGPDPGDPRPGRPQTFTLPEGYDTLIVKKFDPTQPFGFHFPTVESPYTTVQRPSRSPERVWACQRNGGNGCTLAEAQEALVLFANILPEGERLRTGDRVEMLVIDDDDDTRLQRWVALDTNGDIVAEFPQGNEQAMVENFDFVIPQLAPDQEARVTTWAYDAVDSVGVVACITRP